jgi:hypothetical protein
MIIVGKMMVAILVSPTTVASHPPGFSMLLVSERLRISAAPPHALTHLRPQSERVAPNLFTSALKSWDLGSAITPGGPYNDLELGTRALEDALR